MTDVDPNRCGEPVNPLEGTLALHGGEEVRVAKEEINKLPSLDFSDEEVEKIAVKIISEFLSKYIEITE